MAQIMEDFRALIEEGGNVDKFIEENYESLSTVDYYQLFLLAKHTILRMDVYKPMKRDLAAANAIIDFISREDAFTLGEPLNELLSRRRMKGKRIESYPDWDIVQLMFESQELKRRRLVNTEEVYARELFQDPEPVDVLKEIWSQ